MDKLEKIEPDDIIVIYMHLTDTFGFYRIQPGKEPYICLNERLLEGSEAIHLTVFRTLYDYHLSIPFDSIYRCFPLTRYFKELIPLTADEFSEVTTEIAAPTLADGPELVLIGRAARRWTYPVYLPQNFKMIG